MIRLRLQPVLLGLLVVLFGASFGASIGADEQAVDGSFHEAEAALSAWLVHQVTIDTWSATVTQTRELKSLARPLTSSGSVVFARPGRFRWQLGNPPRTIVIGTIEQLLIAYPRLEQLERYDYGAAIDPALRQVIDLLELGFPSSAEAFQARYELMDARLHDGAWTFELQPRSVDARRLLTRVVLEVAAGIQTLRATEFRFPDGSRMRNAFGEPLIDEAVESERFELVVPAGWRVSEPLVR